MTPVRSPGEGPRGSPQRELASDWYRLSVKEVERKLDTALVSGLTDTEARRRLERYGPNEIAERAGRTRLQIFVEQLTGVLTLVLVAAVIISVFLGDLLDAVVILAIIVLNAALGYSQEYRAEQSMAALKRLATPRVRVRRDSQVREVPSGGIVPGDVVLLETGNVIAADGRIASSSNLRVQESALTGESNAVEKEAEAVFEADRGLAERTNLAYSGTTVTYGHGEMLVTGTGMATELGKIADLLQSVGSDQTPLQRRLDRLGRVLALAALGLVIVVFAMGVLRGEDWQQMLLASVSLAVAAVPEALTAVVTIALSLGAQRMLARRALIRKLPAVETLGSVSVICSDKTGTLTQNRMTVTVLDVANHRVRFVQRPDHPHMALVPAEGESSRPDLLPTLDLLLVAGALCNDALLQPDEQAKEGSLQDYRAIGDPTEAALVLAASQVGILKPDLDRSFPRVAELPFDSERKRMTTIHRMPRSPEEISPSLRQFWERRSRLTPSPSYLGVTKGALDGMLGICKYVWVEGRLEPLDPYWRERMLTSHDQLAQGGMRVLGIGVRPLGEPIARPEPAEVEREVVLVGLVGMIDPPRPEVMGAVELCKAAGIRPVMITGDHPLTARHIAREIGISSDERFLTGQELEGLSDEKLLERAVEVSVFARVSPEHKIRLVRAYRDAGHVVAMTGDGVNDAPALKQADIGVAMGIAGTDVSKEAADMVLLDDNFATIVVAVREGRVIYDNIRRVIKYLLTCNISEIAVMLIGPLFGMPLPLLPLQILWMNLVTDGLPALTLGIEPAERDVMRRPPLGPAESIFGHGMVAFIIALGVLMSLVSISIGQLAYRNGDAHWQTLLFTTLIFCQLAIGLGVRSERQSLLGIGLLSNPAMLGAVLLTVALQLAVVYVPFLQVVFNTTALPPEELLVPVLGAVVVLLAVEVWKLALRALDAARGGARVRQ